MPKKSKKHKTVFLKWLTDETYKEKDANGNFIKSNRFIGLPHSLLQNTQFRSLSPNTIKLLLYMLDWACGQQNINFSRTLGTKLMSNATFYKGISELEEKGFIEVERGSFNRCPNQYKFSEKWKNIYK